MIPTRIDDAEGTAAVGSRVRVLAEEFHREAQRIRGRIEEIEGPAPWGHDAPGEQFRRMYDKPVEGGGAFSHLLKEALTGSGGELTRIGDVIVKAMRAYQRTEAENAAGFKVRRESGSR